jgi:hypothetical protein
MWDFIYLLFGWDIDYDKIIADLEEQITEKQNDIRYLEQQINEARLKKEAQRKIKGEKK